MTALDPTTLDLDTELPVTLRFAHKSDLSKLEWDGKFSHFRNLFRRSYQGQLRGRRKMLLADLNGYPIGHIFIQFISRNTNIADGEERAYLYSFRVMERYQGKGIGSRLMRAAEKLLVERGFQLAIIAVAKNNPAAESLYRRRGYQRYAQDAGRWEYTDHHGVKHKVEEPCWLLRKRLR